MKKMICLLSILTAVGSVSALGATQSIVESQNAPVTSATQVETVGLTTGDVEADTLFRWFFIGCTDTNLECKIMARDDGFQFYKAGHNFERCPGNELACWGR